MLFRSLLAGWVAFAIPALASAAEPTPPKGFTALFNGKDFTNFKGWSIHEKGGSPPEMAKLSPEEKQKKFEAWTDDLKKNWTIDNGELVNKGTGAYLATEKDYGDYELMVEYKLAATVDSGIYPKTMPQIQVWAVMVQREVADRWAAPVGSSAYGGPSVLLQLACRSFFLRPVGIEVFMPRPRVQSAIVGLERIGAGPSPAVRALVHAAFAQRRKTLVNALAAAGADKARVLAALGARGLSPTARAQELAPPVFVDLAKELAWTA